MKLIKVHVYFSTKKNASAEAIMINPAHIIGIRIGKRTGVSQTRAGGLITNYKTYLMLSGFKPNGLMIRENQEEMMALIKQVA